MDVIGNLSAAVTLVGLAKKTVKLIYTHTQNYRDRDSKIETIKGELKSFADNDEMVHKVVESQHLQRPQNHHLAPHVHSHHLKPV